MIEIQQIASAVKGLLYTGRISPKIQPFRKFLAVAQSTRSKRLQDSPAKCIGIARALDVSLYTLEGKKKSVHLVQS